MFVTQPSDLETERLEAEIASLYSRISAETCRWLLLVAELDRREAYLQWGCRSCAHWLSWHCGVGLRAAQDHVRVAGRLDELPLIRDAFARGELSYSKARALTRIASEESEAELLELARNASAAQLERVVRAYRRALPPEDLEAAEEARYASFSWDDDGSLVVHARLSAEEGAVLMQAMDLAKDELIRERDDEVVAAERGSDRPPLRLARATNADALVRVAESAVAGAGAVASGGDRTQVVVHIDAGALAEQGTPPGTRDGRRCELEGGPGLAAETARRLACDASVVTLVERDGEPLSVGRKTRTIPPAIRRALRSRDQTCTFPGCDAQRFLDAHHIQHWAHGGETSLSNLVTLCRHHHRLVHEGRFTVQRSAGDVIFRRPSGAVVPGRPPPVRGDPQITKLNQLDFPLSRRGPGGYLELPLAPCSGRFGGEKLDLDHTMFVLMQRFNRAERGIELIERPEQAA